MHLNICLNLGQGLRTLNLFSTRNINDFVSRSSQIISEMLSLHGAL